MKRSITIGKCNFCDGTFSKTAMMRHLNTCKQKQAFVDLPHNREARILHIMVQGRYAPEYWLHLEVVADAKLKALDRFLRGIWLECCGHLSAFTIEGKRYVSMLDKESFFDFGVKEKSMNVKVAAVMGSGMRFSYEYDFGTTTELVLKVLSKREGKPTDKSIQILARNEPPTIICDVCGESATQVCAQCIWNGKGWLCDKCASVHECGEEMLLPVVNSPRVGMCGYVGNEE